MSSCKENQDGSRGDGGSEFGRFGFPSVVQGFLSVFSRVESGLSGSRVINLDQMACYWNIDIMGSKINVIRWF